jgi:autotransporter-associated beta strand protein
MAAGAGTNWSTTSSWKISPGKPANGGSSDTVIHLQAQGNTDQPALFVDIGTAANNGFMLNTLVLTNTSPYNRGFTLSGSNLVFMSNAGVSPMIIGNSGSTGNGNGFTINNMIVLSNSLTIAGVDNGGAVRKIQGVITGVGDITNAVVNGNAAGCLQINNTANTFVGNWVLIAGIVQFATGDATYGNSANGVILLNNAQFQPLSASSTLSWNNARVLTIGAGGGTISAQAGSRILALNSTTSLAGSDLLTLGWNGSLTLNASQNNFTGPVQVGGSTAVATLTLAASNALANASRIVAGNYGLVNLNNAFGAGSLTVTNLANSQTTLGTNLVASGGTTIYLSDLSAVSGTDARLNTLTSGGNLIIAPGAVPMVIHVDANGTAVPYGVNRSSLVYGSTANRGDLTIGDADANQWRGVGVGVGSAVTLGTASSNLTLNGNAELDALSGGTLTINSLITGGDATKLLAIRGGGTVTLNNVNNNFASRIFGAGGTTLNASHTAGTMTLNFAKTNNTFASLQNTTTGTLVLNGESSSTNIITGAFVDNGVCSFNSGTFRFLAAGFANGSQSGVGTLDIGGAVVSLNNGRYMYHTNIVLRGGSLVIESDRFAPCNAAGAVLSITDGLLLVTNTSYGARLECDANGAVSTHNSMVVNQSGGLFLVTNGKNIEMGGTSASKVCIYTISGGATQTRGGGGFILGADTAGTSSSAIILTNAGNLSISGTIQGSQVAGAKQAFIFCGGTLAANTVDASKLSSVVGSATVGSLVNNGGALAPGDVGTAGKTTITGSYTESSANAILAFDIGGTTQATAFQTGLYDYLNVNNGAATIAGRLDVRLINGYTPPTTATKFTVLAVTGTGAALSGSFANVAAGKVWCADGYSRFDVLTPANTVVLSNYVVNAWSPTSGNAWTTGANWTLAEANGSDMAAYFGTGSSGAVTLDTARTVRGLTFNNGSASYTLSGSASLTLKGDTLTTPKLSVTAGSHTISVPMALSNATEIAVAASSVLALSGGITGGQAVNKTGTGTLVLSAANTLGALTVSAGTVKQTAGTTTLASLTLAGGTYDLWTGALLITEGVADGAIDTIAEVESAITAGTIKGRGQTVAISSFKISVVDGYVKVELKMRGTVISFQ